MNYRYSAQIFYFILSAVLLYPGWEANAKPAEEILALVNEVPISKQDLSVEMDLLSAEMQYRNRPLSVRQKAMITRQLVENLIERELLFQRAQQRKIEIRDRWVDRAIADLKTDLKTTAGYKAYLENANLTGEQLKARLQKGLIVRRLLRREVLRQIKVSEAEMQAFYRKHPEFFQRKEQVRIRQIFIAVDPQGDISKRGEALMRIQAVQQKIFEGKNFAALAIEYSEDNSRAVGGDLGYLDQDQMLPAFAAAAFALKPGEISDIVETHLGYHLIQMVDRLPTSRLAYRKARTKIERTLRRNKEKAATDAYLAGLKRQASITRMIP